MSVCRTVADAWQNEREKILAQGDRILAALQAHTQVEPAVATAAANHLSIVDTLREALRPFAATFDPEWGGFGDAPKFPRPVTLTLLTRIHARLAPTHLAESAQARDTMLATLDGMAAGGMHDHLGGGFHRYSVDRFWHVPHFEKMLYDQAQLAVAYLEAFQITGEERYADVTRDILGYVLRDLRSPDGGFYCAEDADSLLAAGRPEHAEGAFYVWTKAEVDALLTLEQAAAFCARYGVEESGNAPAGSDPQGEFTGKNILFTSAFTEGSDARLDEAERILFAARSRRPRPHLDDKIVTAWNGLMISAFARAFRVLGEPRYLSGAARAATFITQHLYDDRDASLLRSYREGPGAVAGFADDYAFFIQALLDLHETQFDFRWLDQAERLQATQEKLFGDPDGGYYASRADDADVLLRLREEHDGAEPAASSVSALNLARLAALTGKDQYRQRAETVVSAFAATANPLRTAQTMPLLLAAADFLAQPPAQVVIAGHFAAEDTDRLARAAYRPFVPNKTVLLADAGDPASREKLVARHPYLADAAMQGGAATAYLCENGACQLPTTDPDELARRLANQNGA